jgi:hypothetical protein
VSLYGGVRNLRGAQLRCRASLARGTAPGELKWCSVAHERNSACPNFILQPLSARVSFLFVTDSSIYVQVLGTPSPAEVMATDEDEIDPLALRCMDKDGQELGIGDIVEIATWCVRQISHPFAEIMFFLTPLCQ